MGSSSSVHKSKSFKTDSSDEGGILSKTDDELQLYIENCEANFDGSNNWRIVDVTIINGKVTIGEHAEGPTMSTILYELDLTLDLPVVSVVAATHYELVIIVKDKKVKVKALDEEQAQTWLKLVRFQIMLTSSNETVFESNLSQFKEEVKEEVLRIRVGEAEAEYQENSLNDFKLPENYVGITAPKMNIAILVVGTRGDVQPFVYFGQQLQKAGHRVRLATHAEYRPDVMKGGLEYYPLGGDPRKLSEYMVKTGGRLIPDLMNKEERKELPEKMKMLKEICYSTWPAVSEPDPEDPEKKPFVADAIISNPVAYGHIHCAEKLQVPLHIMFPQPWYPTMCFPHPLSNLALVSKWSSKNYYSYFMVNELMWLGLGGMINQFRTDVLNLSAIRMHNGSQSYIYVHKVPISHMWSPSFVPKCPDWPGHIDVVGEFRLMQITATNAYKPSGTLATFLAAGPKPIYIGFGSMVIDNSDKLVSIIKAAAHKANCRVLLQSGWTKYAEDETMISDEVMVIGAMPHDFLFTQVAGVIHHGGAGTTSAGLRAGNPTFICPFFGDQHFWAEMVSRSGAGPKGCPVKFLNSEKLAEAFIFMRLESTIAKAKELGDKMAAENGCEGGVNSFYRNLPLDKMICDVSIFHNQQSKVATVFCTDCGLKMCPEVDKFIHRAGSKRHEHKRMPYRNMLWGRDIDDESPKEQQPVHKLSVTKKFGSGVKTVLGKFASKSTKLEKANSMKQVTGRVFIWSEPEDAKLLSPAELTMEHAFSDALSFAKLWRWLDMDGSDTIDESELSKIMSKDQVSKMMKQIDWNGDSVLSFNELAWMMSQTSGSDLTGEMSKKLSLTNSGSS